MEDTLSEVLEDVDFDGSMEKLECWMDEALDDMEELVQKLKLADIGTKKCESWHPASLGKSRNFEKMDYLQF